MPSPKRNQNQNRGDPRAKKCPFCEKQALYIDYKDYGSMKPFTDYFGNIRARYYSGVCLRHQKMLKMAVEKARFMGMLAYRK
jgi:small subunit ribosomal protein S18